MTFPDICDVPDAHGLIPFLRANAAWIAAITSVMTSAATASIAWVVAVISRRQWKTNQEKLRLDLYNRRFEIYRHCVDFAEGLYPRSEMTHVAVEREELFHRSLRESRFLFPTSSGVYQSLKAFDKHATAILATNALKITELQQGERGQAFSEIQPFIDRLGEQVSPLLNFHEV